MSQTHPPLFSPATVSGNARIVGLGDLNGDRRADLVAYDEDAPTVLVGSWDWNDKKPALALSGKIDATTATIGGRIDAVLVADFDRDGLRDDLAILSGGGYRLGINEAEPGGGGGADISGADRTEYGFARTACACRRCTISLSQGKCTRQDSNLQPSVPKTDALSN